MTIEPMTVDTTVDESTVHASTVREAPLDAAAPDEAAPDKAAVAGASRSLGVRGRVVSRPARTRRTRLRLSRPAIAVTVLALLSFVGSVLLQKILFPDGSGDADEAAYVLQARMLLQGRLTLDATVVEPFFRPWLTGEHDGRVFTKYLPGWPAMLAGSQALFGTMVVAPAAVAAGWVVGTFRLARELFADVRTALMAAAGVALSPIVLLHTALPLAYAAGAATLVLAAAELLRGARTGSRPALLLGGASAGFALLIRPFDAVLVLLPVFGLVLVRARQWSKPAVRLGALSGARAWEWVRVRVRTMAHRAGWVGIGALPFVLVAAAYCWYVTGSPLRMPLSASDPLDRFGFGPRRILPSEPSFLFTRRLALDALRETLAAAPSWLFGGTVLVGLAAAGLFAPRRRPERIMLVVTAGVVLGGYSFWWGSAFAMPGLRNGLGPHYHLAAFTPVVILAAEGARWLWDLSRRLTEWLGLAGRAVGERAVAGRAVGRRATAGHVMAGRAGDWWAAGLRLARPGVAVVAGVGLLAITWSSLPGRIDVQRGVNESNHFVDELIPDELDTPAVILVTPQTPSRYTQIPYHTLRNSPDLDDPVVYAADIGPGSAALSDRMPGRTIYRLRPEEIVDPTVPGSFRGSFEALRQVTGTRIEIQVNVRAPVGAGQRQGQGRGPRLYVRLDGALREIDGATSHTFVLTTSDPATGPDEIGISRASLPEELVVGYAEGSGAGAAVWEERIPLVQRSDGELALLAPGLGWRRLPTGSGTEWIAAATRPVLQVSLTRLDPGLSGPAATGGGR
ncbi:hypothetical protein [Parafrankia sp. EUN1f]|uniref:hypothetical protein n=1 Tax=Parafrankia sp. EUN1f TaxID=102897 RepID=UPI0001C46284|nr:hypothetical protein [Parafrankia sp. EUN1f]EFC83586.1 hypothetical protein FrEUN1fDRAFT_3283 [Parafrankia sp. EUN1f]